MRWGIHSALWVKKGIFGVILAPKMAQFNKKNGPEIRLMLRKPYIKRI